MVLHYAISERETIRYCDIISLYSFVYNYSKFPIGHPKFHVGDACWNIQGVLCNEGLKKRTILPPRDSIIPSCHSIAIANFYFVNVGRMLRNEFFRANAYMNRRPKGV